MKKKKNNTKPYGHEEQTCGCQGGGRLGWTGSLGLINANAYI